MNDLSEFKAFAERLAELARPIARHYFRSDAATLGTIDKPDATPVTLADMAIEQRLRDEIAAVYPAHGILGEEHDSVNLGAEWVWVIDPIDGTSNFMRGFPHCSVSIALMEDGVVQHGVVYDPVRDEIFHASKGSGAFLNDRRIRVSPRLGLPGALIATGFPFRQRARFATQMRIVKSLLEEAEDLRRTGSAALDLAYVACGRLDGYFEYGLQPWDMAAGALLVREAGGVVTDFDGGETWFDHGNLMAANLKVAAGMIARIKPIAGKRKAAAAESDDEA